MCVCVCVQTVYLAEFMESNLRERDHTSEKKNVSRFSGSFFFFSQFMGLSKSMCVYVNKRKRETRCVCLCVSIVRLEKKELLVLLI